MTAFSRIDRVQNLIRQEVAAIVDRELDNPALPPFITIGSVKVSKDLSYATVLTTFLTDTDEATIAATIAELNKSAGYIGKLVAQRVQLRRHPQLKFVYNPSTRYALDMEKVFNEIRKDAPPDAPEDGAGTDAEKPSTEVS